MKFIRKNSFWIVLWKYTLVLNFFNFPNKIDRGYFICGFWGTYTCKGRCKFDIPWGTSNFDYIKTLITLKHQPQRLVTFPKGPKKLIKSKHRSCRIRLLHKNIRNDLGRGLFSNGHKANQLNFRWLFCLIIVTPT